MAVYFVTGKLGQGKTLVAVSRIRLKLEQGLPVATNIDINLSEMFSNYARKKNIIRVPDKPCPDDLHSIGIGNESYDESKNGLLVLDECGTWFNSRNWSDKSRKGVNEWFLHARKLGWDVILIVQDISIVDKQAREALAEHTVFCKRMDNIHIPFIGGLYKLLTGCRLRLPRIHIGKVIYGDSLQGPMSDRWVYRGNELFTAYDTKQLFMSDYPHGSYSQLTPWHLKSRFYKSTLAERQYKMARIMWKKYSRPLVGVVGMLFGSIATAAVLIGGEEQHQEEPLYQVEQVQKEVEKKVPERAKKITPLSTILEGYWLAGYVMDEHRMIYYLQSEDGPLLTNMHGALAGSTIEDFGGCQLQITRGTETYQIACQNL